MLRPASPGTGIIAGKTVRAVAESAGIKDLLSKSLGSNNPSNVVKATLAGLQQLRLREDIYRDRGIEIKKKTVAAPVAVAPAPMPAPTPPPVAPPGREGLTSPVATPAAPVTSTAAAPIPAPAAAAAAPVEIPNPQSAIRNEPAPPASNN
jgi:hypothetical protein